MNPSFTALIRGSVLVSASLLSVAHASAQFQRLNDLASEIAKEVKPLKPHLVAVADFRPPNGSTLPQGHYFAWILSSILQDRAKKSFTVADHIGFDSDLARLNISAGSLVPGETLQAAVPHLGADILVTGTFEKGDKAYFLHILPVRIADSRSLRLIEARIEITEFLDSFITPFPEDIRRTSQKNVRGETTMPSCIYCPDPSYTDLARRNHLQGVAIFEVLITAEGLPVRIRPMQLIGNGLDEAAFAAIKSWKFRPATLKGEGTPIATIVPVQITFRLF
jgi:TonB family protein